MNVPNQVLDVNKINDYGKTQKRTLMLKEDGIATMKGSKTQRFVNYEEITGITYNIDDENAEFIIHNITGDLRFV